MIERSNQARAAVKPALWGALGGAIISWIGLVYGIGMMTPSTAAKLADAATSKEMASVCADQFLALGPGALKALKDLPSRDYDDVVIAHVKKVGERVVSTNNRPFAMACGLEVIERDKASPGKAAAG